MGTVWVRLWKEEDGQDLTEYALVLILVTFGSVAALGSLAHALAAAFSSAAIDVTT